MNGSRPYYWRGGVIPRGGPIWQKPSDQLDLVAIRKGYYYYGSVTLRTIMVLVWGKRD